MSNIDLIRQEIDRRIAGSDDAYARALKGILSFIDSLPEETPSDDLEEAGRGYDSRDLYEAYEQGRCEQKEQMMKEAVEGEVVQDLHGKLHFKTNAVSDILYQFGDKVKVIILKQ